MLLPVLAMLGLQHFYFCQAEIYAIRFDSEFYFEEFTDVQATFGPDLYLNFRGMLINATPPSACNESLAPPPPYSHNKLEKWILLVPRYTPEANCSFETKVRMAQLKGYNAVIVHNVGSNDLVPMSANNSTGINISSVFVSQTTGLMLRNIYADPDYFVIITAETPFNIQTHLLIPFAIVVGICFLVMVVFMVVKYIKDRRRQRRYRLPKSQLNKIPTCKFQKGDRYETCAICLEDYIEGEKLRVLPCNHVYHMKCIDPWLTKNKRVCPICKRKVFAHDEPHHDSDSDSDTDDTTPLIRSGNTGTQGGTFQVQNENPFRRAARSISQVLEGRNCVTTSDYHSINAERLERQSIASTDSSETSSDSASNTNTVPSVDFVVHNSDRHDEDDSGRHDNPFDSSGTRGESDNSHHFDGGDVLV
ncbi:E3 ubiquitin-protein ligase RNF13-like isoform X2 [Euwallacea fornicatus]|uniref:E3 ubiquitin-protein ligase RNF13-like isoform X2 n=1 Tax=Euwallacea fornicatus TaxID=995702 RepID=UPI00338E500C